MENIGIIGAGPAGLMAAIASKSENNKVTLIDSNHDIGRKLRLTGGGRCNITNAKFFEDFLENIVTNKKFFYSSFTNFDNYALIDFLNKEGIETIVEDGGRVFPKSEKAETLIGFFRKKLADLKIDFKGENKVKDISYDGRFLVVSNKETFIFDKLIIATGGMSYKKTGSDGSAYKIVESLGHKLIKSRPVLVPIFLEKTLAIRALSLKNIGLKLKNRTLLGDIMINKNFLTGPLALRASSFIEKSGENKIYLDFLVEKSFNDLDELLQSLIGKNPKKTVLNNLKLMVNDHIAELIFDRLAMDKDIRSSELTKETRRSIIEKIKSFDLGVKELGGFDMAIVTRGGVDTKEIDPKTMESKIIEGLYFVGEIIDMDALTGGYNLQISFSTGFTAGSFIKEKI